MSEPPDWERTAKKLAEKLECANAQRVDDAQAIKGLRRTIGELNHLRKVDRERRNAHNFRRALAIQQRITLLETLLESAVEFVDHPEIRARITAALTKP